MTYTQEQLERLHKENRALKEQLAVERDRVTGYRTLSVCAIIAFIFALLMSPTAEAMVGGATVPLNAASAGVRASLAVNASQQVQPWTATVIRCTEKTDTCIRSTTNHATEQACDASVAQTVAAIGETRDVVVAFCLSSEEAHEQAQWEVQE